MRVAATAPPEAGFIFFGAEEVGLLGATHYAAGLETDHEARYVNLDGIGLAGRLRLFGGGPALRSVVQAAREAGVPLKGSPLWPGLLMDHVALAKAGLAAVSLGCVGRASARIHSAGDGVELIEEAGLREAAAVLLAMIAMVRAGRLIASP